MGNAAEHGYVVPPGAAGFRMLGVARDRRGPLPDTVQLRLHLSNAPQKRDENPPNRIDCFPLNLRRVDAHSQLRMKAGEAPQREVARCTAGDRVGRGHGYARLARCRPHGDCRTCCHEIAQNAGDSPLLFPLNPRRSSSRSRMWPNHRWFAETRNIERH